jgi:hypothetical protein
MNGHTKLEFFSGRPFHPTVMFVSKADAYSREGSGITHKH